MRDKCILALALITLISVVAAAQTSAAKSVPGFSFKSPGNLAEVNRKVGVAVAAIPLGNTMVITYSYEKAKDRYHYQSSIINKKGKASKPTTFFSARTPPISNISVLWINNGKTGSAVDGYAIVYLLTDSNDEVERITYLHSILLDSKGKTIGPAQEIATFKVSEPTRISDPSLSVAMGSGSILVTVSATQWQYTSNFQGHTKSYLFVIQTDIAGKAKGQLQSIALPNGGNYQAWHPFTTSWSGNRWFVPMSKLIESSSNGTYIVIGHALYVMSVTPSGNSLKAQLKKVFQTTEKLGGLKKASFIPLADGTTATKTPFYTLVFSTVQYDQNNTVPLEGATTRLFVQTINKKGAPKGAYKEIPLPKRKHAIKSFNESLYLQEVGTGDLSNVALNADGEPVIAIFRGTIITPKSNPSEHLWDTELGIYRIDLKSSEVTATQWSNKNLPAGYLWDLQLFGASDDLRGFANLYTWPGPNRVEFFAVE